MISDAEMTKRLSDEKIDVCKHGAPTRPGVSICAVCRIEELELELRSLRPQLAALRDKWRNDSREYAADKMHDKGDAYEAVADELDDILKGTT